jgi:uncharacterized damage-inducible protein DinB
MTRPEHWLRGPVEGVPALVQPVAHALLQAAEEGREILRDFPEARLWDRQADVASVGFHLQHIAGVVDRLFTYARGEALSEAQREALSTEGAPRNGESLRALLDNIDAAVDRALAQLRSTPVEMIMEPRAVGRQRLPSNVLGLLFHAAEHTQRHVGQMLVTARNISCTNPTATS